MRTKVCVALVIGALAVSAAIVRADGSDAKATIEKGIQAIGGKDNVSKVKAMTWKGKGTFHGLGSPIEYTGEWFLQPPKQMKGTIEADFNGMKLPIIQIVNGDKAYRSMMGNVTELEGDDLAESRNEFYENRLLPALAIHGEEGFKLASLGDSKLEGKAVVGVKVSHEGHADVSLFFDKDSGLLVKSVRKAKDPMTMQDVDQETLYSDYQDVGGVKFAKKRKINRDGKVFNEIQITEYKPVDHLDEKTFAKPAE
jgi:hypothetical protein